MSNSNKLEIKTTALFSERNKSQEDGDKWERYKKKSPQYSVSYNRKSMERTGSLAPDLLGKIERKHKKQLALAQGSVPPVKEP